MRFLRPLAVAMLILCQPGWAADDATLATGRNFSPFLLTLKPSLQMSPLPGWMQQPALVREETATVEIPLPALWQSPTAEFFALTVVFNDRGDGGPAVEWRAPDGSTTAVSNGLGEAGTSLGFNARTVLLPQALTRAGGTLLVSYYGNFESLLSLSVRPARGDLLAVLGGGSDPVLVDEGMRVFERAEVDGGRINPLTGDLRQGSIIDAELSAAVEPLESEIEFLVPTDGVVEGTVLRLDALGLDPEARIEVRVNEVLVGSLGFTPFRLDDPALVTDTLGRLVIAGWRTGTLFIPARLWMEGENSILVTLKRSAVETGRSVFIRNTGLHLRFGGEEMPADPDLTLPDPLVPDPEDIPLPEIITGVR